MGGGKEMSSARERMLSSIVLASAFFCPSEHFSAQLGRKVLSSAFFGCDKMPLSPMVTGLPFFSPFIANFCLFCRKGKSWVVTAQPFFLLFLVTPIST
jgi:hypothetical protein